MRNSYNLVDYLLWLFLLFKPMKNSNQYVDLPHKSKKRYILANIVILDLIST